MIHLLCSHDPLQFLAKPGWIQLGVMAFMDSNIFGSNDNTARTADVLNSHHSVVIDNNSRPGIVPSSSDATPYDNNSVESGAVSVAEFGGSDTDTASQDKEMPTDADAAREDGGNNLEQERKQGEEVQALARTYTIQSRASGAEPLDRKSVV